jgi:predicted phage-related endonuclease
MITQEQREARRKFIGSSDAPAIFGHYIGERLDPHQTVEDVYNSKVHEMPEKEGEWLKTGNDIEAALVGMAVDRMMPGESYEVSPDTIIHGDGISAANLDGIIDAAVQIIVEAKNVGRWAPKEERDMWGEDGTAEIPFRVLIQVHHQMYVTGYKMAYVSALIMGEFRLYEIERDDELCQQIGEFNRRFWKEHVEPGVPPTPDYLPPIEIVKKMARSEANTIALDDAKVARLESVKAEIKALAVEEETLKTQIATALSMAKAVYGTTGNGYEVSYKMQKGQKKADTKRLEKEFPAAYAACVSQGEHPVLRIKNLNPDVEVD